MENEVQGLNEIESDGEVKRESPIDIMKKLF